MAKILNCAISYSRTDRPNDDQAFLRAGKTFAASKTNCPVLTVMTEDDFLKAWSDIADRAKKEGSEVGHVCIFSHASKDSDADGIEFAGGTLTQSEIESLAKLPWASNGLLTLCSCNSGLTGSRGWCPAKSFAKQQGVKTEGMAGYAYFSKETGKYVEQSPSDQTIYLWAYKRGKNGMFGDGSRMPAVVFT